MTNAVKNINTSRVKPSIVFATIDGFTFIAHGGPYRAIKSKPVGMVGVKMAAEINMPCTVSVPTEDYQVPDLGDLEAGIDAVLGLMMAGHPIYVGCMGGIGRTGLMMASLKKVFDAVEGVRGDPIKFVRDNFNSHAVETRDQSIMIRDLDVTRPAAMVRHWLDGRNIQKPTTFWGKLSYLFR